MKFQPGQSGNPKGKPKGTLDKRTRLRRQIEDQGQGLLDVVIKAAIEKNKLDAAFFLLERLIPKAKDSHINFELPLNMDSKQSLLPIATNILKGIESKDLTPEEAKTMLENVNLFSLNFMVKELCEKVNMLTDKIGLTHDATSSTQSSISNT